jgi:hypothetical protein
MWQIGDGMCSDSNIDSGASDPFNTHTNYRTCWCPLHGRFLYGRCIICQLVCSEFANQCTECSTMFSLFTNIYNKKTKGPTLMVLFMATGKQKKFFWQLEMFDECTTGDMAHIHTIFKFLSHMCQHGHISILHWCNDPCLWGRMAMVGHTVCCVLTRVWQELEFRMDVCRVTHGAHIEHL